MSGVVSSMPSSSIGPVEPLCPKLSQQPRGADLPSQRSLFAGRAPRLRTLATKLATTTDACIGRGPGRSFRGEVAVAGTVHG
jgi:hypothetical protein